MNRHYMLEALLLSSGRRLPSAYQEVEFVYPYRSENDYISFNMPWNVIKTIKCGLRSPDTRGDRMLFNTNVANHTPWISIQRTDSVGVTATPPLSSLTSMEKKDIKMVVSSSSTNSISTRHWDGAWNAKIEYYYVEFYDANDELLGNFIPCYRKSDGRCGFYDLVTKTFSGSSYFAKGPDIGSDSIEGNTLSLAPSNTITEHTLNINNGDTIVGNTLNI